MITLNYVTSANSKGRTFKYKTLDAAQKRAFTLVGPHPKRDPDGYAVAKLSGNCLFFWGVTFEDLFPDAMAPKKDNSSSDSSSVHTVNALNALSTISSITMFLRFQKVSHDDSMRLVAKLRQMVDIYESSQIALALPQS